MCRTTHTYIQIWFALHRTGHGRIHYRKRFRVLRCFGPGSRNNATRLLLLLLVVVRLLLLLLIDYHMRCGLLMWGTLQQHVCLLLLVELLLLLRVFLLDQRRWQRPYCV